MAKQWMEVLLKPLHIPSVFIFGGYPDKIIEEIAMLWTISTALDNGEEKKLIWNHRSNGQLQRDYGGLFC